MTLNQNLRFSCTLSLLALTLSLHVFPGLAEAGPSQPVAIVYSLKGTASLTAPGEARRPLQLFDRLAAKTALEVGPGSRVALAFVNGLRYELGEDARVTLGSKDLASRTEAVKALPRVPPLPALAPITSADRPGPRAGAVRIRSEEIEKLTPGGGSVTFAYATVLRFQAVEGAMRYQMEIENSRGNVIFRTVTETPAVSVPSRVLAPGSRYHWAVKTLDRPGPVARGEAGFFTLSRKAAEARERLRRAAEATNDGSLRDLLAAVDHALGLTDETEKSPLATGIVIENVRPRSPGEAAGLQPLEGASGSGKSTLAAVLAGLREPGSGLVLLHGFDRHSLGGAAWRRRVALALSSMKTTSSPRPSPSIS